MDKNTTTTRLAVFESTLEKIRLGIRKGVWRCEFFNQDPPDIHYWTLKALSGDYTVDIYYTDQGSYSFSVNKNEVCVYKAEESSSEAEFKFIKECFIKLLLEYEEFLKIIPD